MSKVLDISYCLLFFQKRLSCSGLEICLSGFGIFHMFMNFNPVTIHPSHFACSRMKFSEHWPSTFLEPSLCVRCSFQRLPCNFCREFLHSYQNVVLLYSHIFCTAHCNLISMASVGYPSFLVTIYANPLLFIFLSFLKFLKISSLSGSTLASFYRYMIDDEFGKAAEEQLFKRNAPILLFINGDGNAIRLRTDPICGRPDDATRTL